MGLTTLILTDKMTTRFALSVSNSLQSQIKSDKKKMSLFSPFFQTFQPYSFEDVFFYSTKHINFLRRFSGKVRKNTWKKFTAKFSFFLVHSK